MNISSLILLRSIFILATDLAQALNAGAGLFTAVGAVVAIGMIVFIAFQLGHRQDVTGAVGILGGVILAAAAVNIVNWIFHATGATSFNIVPTGIE